MRTTAACIAIALSVLPAPGCSRDAGETQSVVVYTSVDQVYAKEVFDRFTEETGIAVRPVFDTEAQKTTGLYRRLLAERDRPQADVFWNGEICRTIQLTEEGLAADLGAVIPEGYPSRWVAPDGRWAAFSLRVRVIVYNTDMVRPEEVPTTLEALASEKWKEKFAIANPVFGTSATHAAALYEALGDEEAEGLLRRLAANAARVVEGNSVVRDLVARGDVPVGLTDSDDFYAGLLDGRPLGAVAADQSTTGAFVIPNSVMMLEGASRPESAKTFVRYLLSPGVEAALAASRCRQLPIRDDVARPDDMDVFSGLKPMEVDYGKVAARMEATSRRMDEIFGI